MQFNLFTVNKKGNSGYRILICLFLVAAVVLVFWSPSLAGKIVVIGQDDNCSAGMLCDPASPGGQHQTMERDADQGGAAVGYNVFDLYLRSFFKDADSGEGRKHDDVFLLDDAVADIPDYYAYTFGNADETGGNAVLLGDSGMGAYGKGDGNDLRGFAPKEHGVVVTGHSKRTAASSGTVGTVQGTRSAYAPSGTNFNFYSTGPAPVQSSADFLTRDQGSNLPTVAGKFEPVMAEADAVFGHSPHTSSSVAGGDPKYRAGQSRGGGSPVQSSSLSLGQGVEVGSFTVRDFFGLKDDQKEGNKPIVMLILVGVGIAQAAILGVIVIRILIERAR